MGVVFECANKQALLGIIQLQRIWGNQKSSSGRSKLNIITWFKILKTSNSLMATWEVSFSMVGENSSCRLSVYINGKTLKSPQLEKLIDNNFLLNKKKIYFTLKPINHRCALPREVCKLNHFSGISQCQILSVHTLGEAHFDFKQ